ncbi:MAG: preprotein translocase subunit SecG [Pseudomonadota bacterium]|nr:preprotein translocase subunit SecG [Pseudomonadota bacterium]
MYTVLLVIHSILVVFLIMIILVQRPSDDGLSGLGGGGGGNQFLTGRSQANLLTRTTAILAALFMGTSLTLAYMANRMGGTSILDTAPAAAKTAPVSAPAPKAKTPAPENTKAKPKTDLPAVPRPE